MSGTDLVAWSASATYERIVEMRPNVCHAASFESGEDEWIVRAPGRPGGPQSEGVHRHLSAAVATAYLVWLAAGKPTWAAYWASIEGQSSPIGDEITTPPMPPVTIQIPVLVELDGIGPWVKCLRCGSMVRSMRTHDLRTCPCGKVSVDGGSAYTRITGDAGDYKLIGRKVP